jgi:hypothetical protein
MAIAKLEPPPRSDFGHKIVSWEKRHAIGKDIRRAVPRESHAEWMPSKGRPDPLKFIAENNKGRQKDLIPLRMGRTAGSPFTFLRGSACVMSVDLTTSPISGIRVGDTARIPGYCGNSPVLDKALAVWAESYGDQTEQDHATLVDSIKRGKTKAHVEGTDEG